MNYIRGYCATNLDNYDCSLVDVFCAVPKIGDKVRVLYRGNVSTLVVCEITHEQMNSGANAFPIIRVELNK